MNYYFITGTSKGIGKALVENLLIQEENYIIGASRTCSIHHPRYQHIHLDLANPKQVINHLPKLFRIPENARFACLINNAGTLGEIGPMGSLEPNRLQKAYQLNTITPALLANSFIQTFSAWQIKKKIVNISSGAGRTPYDGWSTYCSSKAALDMMSQVIACEKQNASSQLHIQSIAPGIVDTLMQKEIRDTSNDRFSNRKLFLELSENNRLISPEKAASRILNAMNESEEVLLDLYEED
ncbi:MAG: SDR family NAD(P)-dependent oxidoreductase [Cytophagales bacterium]|nr:SDR family NAD(P)-dependent oxidoreductase [Cytophagales bacterium]